MKCVQRLGCYNQYLKKVVIAYVGPEAIAGKVINANLIKPKREKKRYSPHRLHIGPM